VKLHELKPLFEEPISTRMAEELWSEHGSGAAQYIGTTIYYARPIEGKSDSQRRQLFEVFFVDKGKRKRYGVMNEEDLTAAFVPFRPNQLPDAEGFLSYRSADVFDAFKYSGDTVKITLGDDVAEIPVKLNKGDYVLRQDDGDNFTYTIEKDSYFSTNYVKKT
jgi:hypothetical protein